MQLPFFSETISLNFENVHHYPTVWLSTDVKSVSFDFPLTSRLMSTKVIRCNGTYGWPVRPPHSECNSTVERCDSRSTAFEDYSYHGKAVGEHKIIALTNNFGKVEVSSDEAAFLGWNDGAIPNHLRQLFDDFCDSSAYGMRLARVKKIKPLFWSIPKETWT